MKPTSTFKFNLITCLFLFSLVIMPFNLYSQGKDTIPDQSKSSYYTASSNGSDYYIYATWGGLHNACAITTSTTMHIDYYDYDNTMGKQYVISGISYYTGTAYKNAIGPSKTDHFYFHAHYLGWFCDY